MVSSIHDDSFPMMAPQTSKFGVLANLSNESSVEQFFVSRLLADLGYTDAQVKPKASLATLKVSKGRKSEKWRPDYALTVRGKVHWICEAKSVEEKLDNWVGQSQSYCLALNSEQDSNPVEFFMLTNGVTTRVYRWDNANPLFEADFGDFVDDNQAYASIRSLLEPAAFSTNTKTKFYRVWPSHPPQAFRF